MKVLLIILCLLPITSSVITVNYLLVNGQNSVILNNLLEELTEKETDRELEEQQTFDISSDLNSGASDSNNQSSDLIEFILLDFDSYDLEIHSPPPKTSIL